MPAQIAFTPQQEWQRLVLDYAAAINQFVAKGEAEGWDACGPEPEMGPSAHLLEAWRAGLDEINRGGADSAARAKWRRDWPPAHTPLLPLLDAEAQSVSAVAVLDDGAIVARTGAPYESGRVLYLKDGHAEVVGGVDFFGFCPAHRYVARSNASGVTVSDGWHGPQAARMDWPFQPAPAPTQLIPFPDGQRVLLVSADGIFVLAKEGARRILPSGPDEEGGLSMEHGAVSPDGRWIAIGCQDGPHTVLDAGLAPVASIGPVGEYPHFALFNRSATMAIFNACHFYNGATLGVAVKDLPGLETDFYSDDPRTPTLQEGARVYAAVHRGDEFIIGDANGYIRAFSETGEPRWQQFLGSTITAMDLSADGTTLAVASHAGFVAIYALDAGAAQPWQIGTGAHVERERWLLWKNADKPLLW